MVKFWPNEFGSFNSGKLNLAQISFLKSLKEGDKFIIFVNDDGSLTLKLRIEKEKIA